MIDFVKTWNSRLHRLKAWCRSLWVDTIRNSCSSCPRTATRCLIELKDWSSSTKKAPLLGNQSLTRPSYLCNTKRKRRCSSIIYHPLMRNNLKMSLISVLNLSGKLCTVLALGLICIITCKMMRKNQASRNSKATKLWSKSSRNECSAGKLLRMRWMAQGLRLGKVQIVALKISYSLRRPSFSVATLPRLTSSRRQSQSISETRSLLEKDLKEAKPT